MPQPTALPMEARKRTGSQTPHWKSMGKGRGRRCFVGNKMVRSHRCSK